MSDLSTSAATAALNDPFSFFVVFCILFYFFYFSDTVFRKTRGFYRHPLVSNLEQRSVRLESGREKNPISRYTIVINTHVRPSIRPSVIIAFYYFFSSFTHVCARVLSPHCSQLRTTDPPHLPRHGRNRAPPLVYICIIYALCAPGENNRKSEPNETKTNIQ